MKANYEANYEPVERVDILIKFSPCHCLNSRRPKLNDQPCTQVLANLKSQYPNIEFNIYFMVHYDRKGWHTLDNCVLPGKTYLKEVAKIENDYFLNVVNNFKSKNRREISDYTFDIYTFDY